MPQFISGWYEVVNIALVGRRAVKVVGVHPAGHLSADQA